MRGEVAGRVQMGGKGRGNDVILFQLKMNKTVIFHEY